MKIYLAVLGLLASFPVWAEQNLDFLLNKVTLQLHSEQWVTTKTALVNVLVNAAVTNQGIDKIQNDIMQKLNQIARSTDWRLVSFDRQLDKSGLESIQISAQARLAQTDLANLRDKAKSLSAPGMTFTIDTIQFTPSEDELRTANINLRNQIYQQVKAETDALNRMYTDQKYYVHQINFISSPVMMPMAMQYGAKAVGTNSSSLSVGNKQELQATVVLASMSQAPMNTNK